MTKEARGEKEVAAKGHNSDTLKMEYIEKLAQIYIRAEDAKDVVKKINGEAKDVLNDAKNDGFLKIPLRKEVQKKVKESRLSEEQRQAIKEVDSERLHVRKLCDQLKLI